MSKATETLARRIAYPRETLFGRFWTLTPNLQHADSAYTGTALRGHTDTTYFTEPIGYTRPLTLVTSP